MKQSIRFTECEHIGDLHVYYGDLISSGASIIDAKLLEEEEEAIVIVEIKDVKDFKKKFNKTESFEFSNYG